jgi:glycosyltransferase involved in cell wall biosynthesis
MSGPEPQDLRSTLVVSGHFEPAVGGIQTFTEHLVSRLDPAAVVVAALDGWRTRAMEPGQPSRLACKVVRTPTRSVLSELPRVIRTHGCTTAWIPAAAPYALLAPWLRRWGIDRIVASTHGQEVGWVRCPATRQALRRALREVDVVTVLGPWTGAQVRPLVADSRPLHRLAGAVDPGDFPLPSRLRDSTTPPTAVAVSRLVPRKGLDLLLRAWPHVERQVPGAQLRIVGSGPMESSLRRAASEPPLLGRVHVQGSLTHAARLDVLHAADVFVAPSRDRWGGLQVEGLGLSTLEAASTGLPVVVGQSGGSADTLVHGVTGLLTDATSTSRLGDAMAQLLGDPVSAAEMGAAGAAWVRERWTWDESARRLAELLAGTKV